MQFYFWKLILKSSSPCHSHAVPSEEAVGGGGIIVLSEEEADV